MFGFIFSIFTHMLHIMLGIGTQQNFPPPLEPKTEAEYFKRMANGDEEAREKLILHNLRLVSHIVRKYYSASDNQEDLVSIGTIGLVKAVETFNKSSGTKFATYAAKCIQNEILMYFRARKKLSCEVSLNETIDIDKDGNPLTYSDIICSEEDFTEEINTKLDIEKLMRLVDSVLTAREKEIVVMRYGLYQTDAMTQREVAERMGISRSYVSRIEQTALSKLLSAFQKP